MGSFFTNLFGQAPKRDRLNGKTSVKKTKTALPDEKEEVLFLHPDFSRKSALHLRRSNLDPKLLLSFFSEGQSGSASTIGQKIVFVIGNLVTYQKFYIGAGFWGMVFRPIGFWPPKGLGTMPQIFSLFFSFWS